MPRNGNNKRGLGDNVQAYAPEVTARLGEDYAEMVKAADSQIEQADAAEEDEKAAGSCGTRCGSLAIPGSRPGAPIDPLIRLALHKRNSRIVQAMQRA